MSEYRYVTYDILTRNRLTELPLRDVSFGSSLTDPGDFTAKLPLLGVSAAAAAALEKATAQCRTAVYVYRDERLLWGGPIWLSRYDTAGVYVITAKEWRSYLARRYLTIDKEYTASEQLAICRDLITWCQNVSLSARVGIAVGGEVSGVDRDRTYLGSDLHSIDGLIQDMSDNINGFDWTVEVTQEPDQPPGPVAVFGYPRLGRTVDESDLVWEFSDTGRSSILSYEWPEDGDQFATCVIGVGGTPDGEDTAIRSTATNTVLHQDGYPLVETTVSRPDVTVQDTLDDIAEAEMISRATPLVEPSITVRTDADPQMGTWRIGDDCRVRIVGDKRWPDGLDQTMRIIGYHADPVLTAKESIKLLLAPVLGDTVRIARRSRTYQRVMTSVQSRLMRLEARQ